MSKLSGIVMDDLVRIDVLREGETYVWDVASGDMLTYSGAGAIVDLDDRRGVVMWDGDMIQVASDGMLEIKVIEVTKSTEKDMSKEALQKVQAAEIALNIATCGLEEARKELEASEKALKESEELKEYDWEDSACYCIGIIGDVAKLNGASGASLFYFSTKPEADKFAKKLKIMSVLNNLKKSLGDDTEVDGKGRRCYLEWDANKWTYDWHYILNAGQIVFSGHNIDKVVDYMNEHYPEGWS